MIDAEYLKRVEIARDESERLLREVYLVLCRTPSFQHNHPKLDDAVRSHLHGRSRFLKENAS